jgi:anti-sigma factor RsiW
MNGKCFEIGTIQAFLDGETSPDVSLRLTDHVASCDVCALALAQADEENSVVFSTLERELNVLVPTQRLWTRINESLTVEENRVSVWQKLAAFVVSSFANPSIAVAAGVVLVLGMFAIVLVKNEAPVIVADNPPVVNAPVPTASNETVDIATIGGDAAIPTAKAPLVTSSNLPENEIRALAASARTTQPIKPQHAIVREPLVSADGYFPGEESYVKTISDLKQNVDDQKDSVLTPSTRVSYERDMAVVNDSIKRMREVVKKNPKNQAARQVLYSSYQDKIDLLNSVAQREELIASLK